MVLPDYPLAFYPVAALAILVTGIAKGGVAAGSGGIAVPLMAMFVTPPEAAGIMLPILCAMDLFALAAYRGQWSWPHLRRLLPGAMIGIALGALAFGALSANAIRLALGIIAVAFALNQMLRVTERIARRLAARRAPPGRVAGVVWGTLSGFTSTLAHAGAPPFVIYMLPQKLDKATLMATSVMFFTITNYTKLVPYAFLGQLNFGNLATALMFAPLAPLGVWLGVRLQRRLSEAAFYRVSYVLLLVLGLKLIHDGLA
jgi:uncharacterized membrane protein YfcA